MSCSYDNSFQARLVVIESLMYSGKLPMMGRGIARNM